MTPIDLEWIWETPLVLSGISSGFVLIFIYINILYILDGPINETLLHLPDLDSLREQSLRGAGIGFTGKQVIHPAQVPIVQEAFSPSPEQVEWATELIKAFEAYQSTGQVGTSFVYRSTRIMKLVKKKGFQEHLPANGLCVLDKESTSVRLTWFVYKTRLVTNNFP